MKGLCIFMMVMTMLFLAVFSMAYADEALDKAKILYTDASINLELAQAKFNEARQNLVKELNKPAVAQPEQQEI